MVFSRQNYVLGVVFYNLYSMRAYFTAFSIWYLFMILSGHLRPLPQNYKHLFLHLDLLAIQFHFEGWSMVSCIYELLYRWINDLLRASLTAKKHSVKINNFFFFSQQQQQQPPISLSWMTTYFIIFWQLEAYLCECKTEGGWNSPYSNTGLSYCKCSHRVCGLRVASDCWHVSFVASNSIKESVFLNSKVNAKTKQKSGFGISCLMDLEVEMANKQL